jgi:serine/threonine protein kinase/glutamate/tyrosine decarboxylase-like PLP-dependent enzyme
MGQVFLARDKSLGRNVAIKFIAESIRDDQEASLRFDREARAAARITSEYVVNIHALDEVDGLKFIVSEFIDGTDLSDLFASTTVPIDRALNILTRIAMGLSAAHENGVIHRDVKPANIRLRPNGLPVIVDFGLGKLVATGQLESTQVLLTGSDSILGTLPYMSPEQLHGHELHTSTDIFSLGVVAFQLLTRQLPFHGSTQAAIITAILHHPPPPILSIRPDTPPGVASLIEQCLDKNASVRPDALALVTRFAASQVDIVPITGESLPTPVRPPNKVAAQPDSPEKEHNGPGTAVPPLVDTKGEADDSPPLAAWFLGPRAENAPIWSELFNHIFTDYAHWRKNYFPGDPVIVGRERRRSPRHEAWLDNMTAELDRALNELKHHFPFHSPRYIGHMLSEQTLPSVLGLFAGILYNPNNVTEEAAPITVKLELEVGRMVAEMLGYNSQRSWAHLTSGGTLANVEALWVARAAQLVPLFVREYCGRRQINFVVKRSDGVEVPIADLELLQLVNIRPNEAIFMLRRLARFVHRSTRRPLVDVLKDINDEFATSEFNVARRGLGILHKLNLKPVAFVSASAHYSIAKTMNVLGYGEDSLRLIDVNNRFQVNLDSLHDAVFGLRPNEYITAVIGIVGTTEEGAVDRIHSFRFLRDQLEKEQKRSFWLHVDAAWGGYIRTLFRGAGVPKFKHGSKLDEICDAYVKALGIEEQFRVDFGGAAPRERVMSIRWAEREMYASFLAMADADSITVDPHKMGYVPYPAGLIAFRNGLVTELITQRAQYISDASGGIKGLDELAAIDAVGPYVLEGSKAGAVALSCWLAHKTIPLTARGHGKIVRTTLLNTKKLFKYLVNHRHMFQLYHSEFCEGGHVQFPFTFVPLFEPDTNIVCFVVRPMAWQKDVLIDIDVSLDELNSVNGDVYHASSIGVSERRSRVASSQPFYLSRTRFLESQYRFKTIDAMLNTVGVAAEEYRQEGLFVLRSTVMNPWYYEAERAGIDYLKEFVGFLHKTSYAIMAARNTRRA